MSIGYVEKTGTLYFMKPFSHNIIFFDTEFSDLNIRTGELLSIGMVKEGSGEELYLEFDYTGPMHPWVTQNVLPILTAEKKYSKLEAREKLREFVGAGEPYLMAYVNQFDAVFWYDLFGSPKDHPAFWIPLDFASILFAHGYDPNSMGKDSFFSDLGIDKAQFKLHNALDDARMLKQVYEALVEVNRQQ